MSRHAGIPNREPKHTTPEHGAMWRALHSADGWVTSTELAACGLARNTVRKTTKLWAERGWLQRIPGDHMSPSRVRLTRTGRERVPQWLTEDEWSRA